MKCRKSDCQTEIEDNNPLELCEEHYTEWLALRRHTKKLWLAGEILVDAEMLEAR